MDSFLHQQALLSRSRLFIKIVKVVGPALMLIGLVFVGGWWRTAYAQQKAIGASPVLANQSFTGIQGYVVGNSPVAAYTCPDTVKCAIKLTLNPGAVVLIVDNVVGGNVPGLNDSAWRKIVYQGLTLYVPLAYIRVGTPGSGPGFSLVQTSFEDDSTSSPNSPNTASSFQTAPASSSAATQANPPTYFCLRPLRVSTPALHLSFYNGVYYCCPPGMEYNGTVCATPELHTGYIATDGRIDGNAGDRIAIYCRKTGRIEVWSINNGQGHFLVEFNHTAIDVAGNKSFTVYVGSQGMVTFGGDGHGLYWAAIHGGPFHATGTGDFAKIFHCYVA